MYDCKAQTPILHRRSSELIESAVEDFHRVRRILDDPEILGGCCEVCNGCESYYSLLSHLDPRSGDPVFIEMCALCLTKTPHDCFDRPDPDHAEYGGCACEGRCSDIHDVVQPVFTGCSCDLSPVRAPARCRCHGECCRTCCTCSCAEEAETATDGA